MTIHGDDSTSLRIALVLWNGGVGGAETFIVALAREMRKIGVKPTVVFITTSQPLSNRLDALEIPYKTLGLRRGSHVVWNPRRFAATVGSCGVDGALLDSMGFQSAALRLGGYRARIVSVEHGVLIHLSALPLKKRIVRLLDRASGVWATDVEVAVSNFVLNAIRRKPHARQLVRIYNGVDLTEYTPGREARDGERCVVGWAGRMIWEKGLDELVRAFTTILPDASVELRLAGDGPDRGRLEGLVDEMGIRSHVVFRGSIANMPRFWQGCDVAAFPTSYLMESFGLAAVEAMACALPVVVPNVGGIAEIVNHERTGLSFTPGDTAGLARALRRYVLDPGLRTRHGIQARRDCERRFDVAAAASRYIQLYSCP